MGAWGYRAFQNDAAQDWLLGNPSVADVRRVIERGTSSGQHVPTVKDCELAVAACELVASARQAPPRDTPPHLEAWVLANGPDVTQADVRSAGKAVTAVERSSSLQELCDEDERHEDWHQELGGLMERLVRAGGAG